MIIEFANIEELLGKIGLKSVVLKSGKYKDILSPTRELQSEERRLIQMVIDDIHGQFVDAVAQGRGMEREKVASLADGRIFSGKQARDAGLVDELGNMQAAINRAVELAGIEGEPNIIYPEKKRPSIWDFLFDSAVQRTMRLLQEQRLRTLFLYTTG